ncbi:MAG: hypothetical protein MUC47_02605, partial [Candidatus Kapabacteria bacterium]|nr:hypothetical protein [Candidatus Kapabacteria bacterium]
MPRVLPAIAVAVACLLAIAFMYSGALSILNDPQELALFFADTTRILAAILGGMLFLCCLLYASIEAVSSLGAWYRAYSEHGQIPEDEQAKPFVAGIRRNFIKFVLAYIVLAVVVVAVIILLFIGWKSNSSANLAAQVALFAVIAMPIAIYIAV